MVTSNCIIEQMRKLAAVYKDLGPEPQKGDITPSWWRELVAVMKGGETEHQVRAAVATIMAQPQRRFAPKPGELSAAIDAECATVEAVEPDWGKGVKCWTCRDTGLVTVDANREWHELAWCTCPSGQADAAENPEYLGEYNGQSKLLAEKIRRCAKKGRPTRRGSISSAADILGR